MKTLQKRVIPTRIIDTKFKPEFDERGEPRIRIVQIKPHARWWHNSRRQSRCLYADERSAQQAMYYGSVTWTAWERR